MIGLLGFVLAVLASPFKSKLRLEAENTVLRHQLIVLRRGLHGRVRLTNNDCWFFIQLYRWLPSNRLSLLLALEVAHARRATTNRDGSPWRRGAPQKEFGAPIDIEEASSSD